MQLGTREIRHIILNNQVVNSSRALHSLKHTVPKSHKNIAIHMVDHIRRLGVFPANYALDLGEFIDSNGNSYIDIVELNPISCSMCYVNNSIYADVVPEIGECQRQLMMGAEFCYDAIANPKNYDMLLRRFHGTKKRGKRHLSVGSVRDPWGRHQPVTVHFSQVFFASSKACLMGLLRLPIAVAVHGQF